MNASFYFWAKTLGLALTTVALSLQPARAQSKPPLDANDVSILFPLPESDVSDFISIAELKDGDGNRLLSDEAFKRFMEASESSDSRIVDQTGRSTQISFPSETKDIKNWLVAGIRLDIGAPGLSAGIQAKFGQIPQIRLILQPVIHDAGGTLKVQDRAAHIIFNFVTGLSAQQENCPIPAARRVDPDRSLIRAVLSDFVALRDDLASGKIGSAIDTKGPLNVHPGLAGPDRKLVRDRLQAILEKHLKASQVSALAVMGLPKNQPEPWIFMAMRRDPRTDVVQAVPSPALDGHQKAQLLKFLGSERVLPLPHSDNQSAVTTCFRTPNTRVGVSTAELFSPTSSTQRTADVTGIVADPVNSHFFNTDCVSCHTETRLLLKKIPDTSISGVDVSVLPETNWNVRNFGWGFEFGRFKPTITRRTATETEEVVEAANELLNH